jgi:1-acyl-sn-glycerol-3-phosphate acyltransferase
VRELNSSVGQVDNDQIDNAQLEGEHEGQVERGGAQVASERPLPPASSTDSSRRSPHDIPELSYGWPSRLRSYLILDPLIWFYTLFMGLLAIPGGMFDRDGRRLHWFSHAWSWLIMKSIFSPVKVSGLDKIDTSKPHVYAVNHASALDIPVLYTYFPFQFRIAFKKELLAYPIVGWQLRRSGQVCIDQQNPARSISSIRSALKGLKAGLPLVIYPEGGRTPDGEIKPFLPGAFFSGHQGAGRYRPRGPGRHLRTAAHGYLPHQVPSAGDARGRAYLDRRTDVAGYGSALRAGAEGRGRALLQRVTPRRLLGRLNY